MMPIMITKLTTDTHFFSKSLINEPFMLSTAQCAYYYSDDKDDNKYVNYKRENNYSYYSNKDRSRATKYG